MAIKLHTLQTPAHFEALRSEAIAFIGRTKKLLTSGQCDRQVCYGSLCDDSLRLGCITMILDRGDDEARSFFQDAAKYALEWLHAPGSTGAPRVFDVNVTLSE